ncbi:MAG: universal stress protein [Candidatus Azotimanducaceae bacterium WSBS_2022_MAG_OTU7]
MGKRYSKILLAVDFHDDNAVVVETAQDLAGLYKSELHIVHVNEPLGMAYAADGISWGDQVYALESNIHKESQKKMNELAHELKLPDGQIHLLEGRPALRIHELCEAQKFDLIVMGTHGQSGLQLLLGSTANSVLHGSGCDVLAIRIG